MEQSKQVEWKVKNFLKNDVKVNQTLAAAKKVKDTEQEILEEEEKVKDEILEATASEASQAEKSATKVVSWGSESEAKSGRACCVFSRFWNRLLGMDVAHLAVSFFWLGQTWTYLPSSGKRSTWPYEHTWLTFADCHTSVEQSSKIQLLKIQLLLVDYDSTLLHRLIHMSFAQS